MENNDFKCEFCNKFFCSLSSLTNHKKTAKYCLKIQKEKFPNMEIVKKEFKCEYFNKLFSSKNNLILHISTCKNKIEEELFAII